jgi:type I restriction enzyme, S subunit
MSIAVKRGYKQTEVGVIPEDWDVTTVNEIASSDRNSIVGGPFGSDLVSNDYVESGVPVIRGQNMSCRWVSGSFVFVTHVKAKSLEANLARSGDIIFTQRGTLGQVSVVPEQPFDRYLVSQSQMKLTLDKKNADSVFFYYVFSSSEQQSFIKQNTIQTGIPHINLGILKTIPVQLPSLSEQEAIAEALSDADAFIESLEQLIAKNRQIKQGAMQELLTGKKRLPGFSGEWEVRRLEDVVQIRKGELITGNKTIEGTVPVIAGGKKPAYFHNQPNREGKTITISASGASAGYVAFFDIPIFASDCSTISAGEGYSIEYVYYNLQLRQEDIYKSQTGGAQPHIHPVDLMPIELLLPSLTEQSAIASVFSDMDAEIAALESKLVKARWIKQGIMHNLLTGKIRLV